MTSRSFTLEEANALLPALESMFERLAMELESLQSARDRIAVLHAVWGEGVERPTNPDNDELRAHREDAQTCARRMELLIQQEVVDRGIRFPGGGLEHGLLDFPARLGNRHVFLCWRRGEPQVDFWHDVDRGFAGRQRIGPAERVALGGNSSGGADPAASDPADDDSGETDGPASGEGPAPDE